MATAMTRFCLVGSKGTDRIDKLRNGLNRADGSVPFMILDLAPHLFDLRRRRLSDGCPDPHLAPSPRPPLWINLGYIMNPSEGAARA